MDPKQWLDEHGDVLYGFAMQRANNPEIAADLVQETLLAAWKSHASYSGKSSVRTWLIGILKHKWIDYLRKEIRQREHAEFAEGDPTAWFDPNNGEWLKKPEQWHDDPAVLCQDGQFMKVLKDCVDRLPEKQRMIFDMREFQGLESREICKACEVSSTNVHVLLHRARLGLRHCLDHNWFAGEKTW